MRQRQLMVVMACVAVASGTWIGLLRAAEEPQDSPHQRGGSVVGTLIAKGDNFVEVKADGEERARRYVPEWKGGLPQDGGGPDKVMVKTIRELKVGSRLRLDWKFEERPRVLKVEVLKVGKGETADHEPAQEGKKGTVAGTLTEKGKGVIAVRADGEEAARQYYLHFGGTKELLKTIEEAPVGSRVRIEWLFVERPRVLKMEVIPGSAKP